MSIHTTIDITDVEGRLNKKFFDQDEQKRIMKMVKNAIQEVYNHLNYMPSDQAMRPVVLEMVVNQYYHPEKKMKDEEIVKMLNELEESTSNIGVLTPPIS